MGVQEEYVKDEMRNLKREFVRAKEVRARAPRRPPARGHPISTPRAQEVKRIQSVPLVIGQFLEMIDAHHGIVASTSGSNYFVRILRHARTSGLGWTYTRTHVHTCTHVHTLFAHTYTHTHFNTHARARIRTTHTRTRASPPSSTARWTRSS